MTKERPEGQPLYKIVQTGARKRLRYTNLCTKRSAQEAALYKSLRQSNKQPRLLGRY